MSEKATIVRKPWRRPVIERIVAGQAELSQTPVSEDGPFSAS